MEKLLSQLIESDYPDILIKDIKTNSRLIEPGDLFVCINGKVDRHEYIPFAIEKGAVCIIGSKDIKTSVPYIRVENPDAILDELYSKFYDYPQNKLKLIGVTGTDGKTSTTTIIQTLIGDDICGYIGTNGYSCRFFKRDTDNTTPGKETLYRILYEFACSGMKYVAMEASSEAFFYNRLDHIRFHTSGYTNIDSEHLNTHKTLENYIACKSMLFAQTDNYSILNSHDLHFNEMKKTASKPLTYGFNETDDLYIKNIESYPNRSVYNFVFEGKEHIINTKLLGKFNAENLACAMLILLSMGFKEEWLLKNVENINIPGRMDVIDLGQNFHCIVDYAHTPNGLTRLFEFVKTLDINRVISVSGQAGERDASKRKYVGKIIADNSDKVFFTYEDPRHEDVNHIIDDMCELIKDYDNYERILDRHDAIKAAIDYAKPNDLVLILGKGSEDGNYIGDEWVYFVDNKEAEKAILDRLCNNH